MIVSLDLNERRNQMQQVLKKVLGEWCYIVFSSELQLEPADGLGGLTSRGLHSLIQRRLPEAYRGPAAALMVCDVRLRKLKADPAAMLFDGVVFHEAAHIACAGVDDYSLYESNQTEDSITTPWRDWPAHTAPADWPAKHTLPKWIGHDVRFIRALIHVTHRFRSRGHVVWLDAAFGHADYGLSSAELYRESLGDEPAVNSWLPIHEVLAKPLPDEIMNLWGRDIAASLNLPRS